MKKRDMDRRTFVMGSFGFGMAVLGGGMLAGCVAAEEQVEENEAPAPDEEGGPAESVASEPEPDLPTAEPGVAVVGAFSLVRFRSVPGSAREISAIFFAMAIGLATGMGYVGVALLFLILVGLMTLLLTRLRFGESRAQEKELRITIPESLDYSGIFDDLFAKYTKRAELVRVKTSGMGSLYELHYRVALREPVIEKAFLDDLRCRNGNLTISCGPVSTVRDEL